MSRPAQWAQPPMPIPVGTGPFHVKGVLYVATQKYFNTQVEGGLAKLASTLEDEQVRDFIQQKFLPSSWYDVLPVAPLIRAEAECCNQTVSRYLRQRARFQAQEDIGGVYRWLLKLASPETIALKLPRLLTQIFDFGESQATPVSDGRVHIALKGFPRLLGEWYTNAFEVYAETALELAGAKNISLHLKSTAEDAGGGRIPLVTLEGDIHWDP
jgi:hypothetical protein